MVSWNGLFTPPPSLGNSPKLQAIPRGLLPFKASLKVQFNWIPMGCSQGNGNRLAARPGLCLLKHLSFLKRGRWHLFQGLWAPDISRRLQILSQLPRIAPRCQVAPRVWGRLSGNVTRTGLKAACPGESRYQPQLPHERFGGRQPLDGGGAPGLLG